MFPRRVGLLLAFALVATLVPAPAATADTEYFLAPNGSDSASGSSSDPWATFDHALSALGPGDTLTVRGGLYEEEVRNPRLQSASPGNRITVRAYPGERPVLRGLLWLRDMDYWRFDGISVTWGNADHDEHMVKLTDGTGWEFVNAQVWGARSFAGILVATTGGSEPTGWRIASNCIHDTIPTNSRNNDHLIYTNSGQSGSGVIEGNLLFNAINGNGVKLGGSSATEGGASNVTVRYNTVFNTNQSVLASWQSSNNLIQGNLLYGVQDNYANIRAYQLAGSGNRAADNLGGGSTGLFLNDAGYRPVSDAGGNRYPVEPDFDSTADCSGFLPTKPAANGFGHTVLGRVPGPADGDVGAGAATRSGDVFVDDDHSVFEGDIEKLAAAGITRGCAPDRFCPDDPLTRGAMAALLSRGLHYTGPADDAFDDDGDSVFEDDIDRLARQGVARGCNPPENDRFCPDAPLTRAQMASFLVRALELPSESSARFADTAGSVHASDIQALAVEGITKGCNPPANDRFCPDSQVTRGEMAAFLARALNLP